MPPTQLEDLLEKLFVRLEVLVGEQILSLLVVRGHNQTRHDRTEFTNLMDDSFRFREAETDGINFVGVFGDIESRFEES